MEMCRRCALYAAEKRGWDVVGAYSDDGSERTPDEITELLLSIISEVI